METLSVKEVADLKGCTERYVRRQILEGILTAETEPGKLGGGTSGISYRIPLASLDQKLVRKYLRQQKKKSGGAVEEAKKPALEVSLEKMTLAERREVADWKIILQEWHRWRNQDGGRGRYEELDEQFVSYISAKYPEYHFSRRILQRQDQALRERGEAALMDRRGKHPNHKRKMPTEVMDTFLWFYLDESQKTVQKCIRLTQTWAEHEGRTDLLPLPSRDTFKREILRQVPPGVIVYCRKGEKACTDTMLPSVRRTYDDIKSNDIWVCDNHTFDVLVNDGEHQKPIRVYLTAFQDVRSRKFTGWYVTTSPNSTATLIALRRGIEACGIPRQILSDNGREFLTHDIGGRGFRRSAKPQEHEAPTILDHLGIEFRTALPQNGRAKIIERAFKEVKEDFSRMFSGYTGGTILERPERLKKTGKDAENFDLLPEFIKYVDKFISGIYNKKKHNGIAMRGRTPDQVWAACLEEQRVATQEQLNLMLLRNTRMQTVARDGVHLDLYGGKVYFQSPDLNLYHIGRKVYLRYDPDHLETVRVYDDQDRFLCEAQQTGTLGYFADKEAVAAAQRDQRSYKKAVKTWKEKNVKQAQNALELLMWQAQKALEEDPVQANPKILRIQHVDAEAEAGLARAAGMDTADVIDYTEANKRLRAALEQK